MSLKKNLLIVFVFCNLSLSAQWEWWEELSPMPEPVTNNAVTNATVNGVPFIYSFSGLDESKECGKNHLRSFRYDTSSNEWETIDDLPDSKGGKVAAGASTVKNKIYIIGGYHISNSCGEISSRKVNIYDPETNSYLSDGADIPIAIDDHVQAVYRDSLIFVITGWSNTTNVVDVQIYNPNLDEWTKGTSVPNDPEWRVFGASGSIVGDTIYFLGGAKYTCATNACFEPSRIFRKGYINPNDPTDIIWSSFDAPLAMGYRMGAFVYGEIPFWFGGSELTYNFDGIDYNGSGGVSPLSRLLSYNGENLKELDDNSYPAIMDLRGVAQIDETSFVVAGGMLADQVVSDRTVRINLNVLLDSNEDVEVPNIKIYPNPTDDFLRIESPDANLIELYSISGDLLYSEEIIRNSTMDVSNFTSGVYLLSVTKKSGIQDTRKIIIK